MILISVWLLEFLAIFGSIKILVLVSLANIEIRFRRNYCCCSCCVDSFNDYMDKVCVYKFSG